MKGKSIVMMLGSILLLIVAITLFFNGDILYGVATLVISVVLFFFGFTNRHKKAAFKDYDQSLNSHFNISGSGNLNKEKKDKY